MVNVVNVRRVADAIERHEIADLGFNMSSWKLVGVPELDKTGHNCGTVACIGGWTDAVLGNLRDDETVTQNLLGIDGETANKLFYMYDTPRSLNSVSPANAVRTLRHLADTYERTGVAEVKWDFDAEPAL